MECIYWYCRSVPMLVACRQLHQPLYDVSVILAAHQLGADLMHCLKQSVYCCMLPMRMRSAAAFWRCCTCVCAALLSAAQSITALLASCTSYETEQQQTEQQQQQPHLLSLRCWQAADSIQPHTQA
jgi:hypothetical protein